MRALVFDDHLRFTPDHPLPERPGEALVRVSLAGVCATDLEILRGYLGFRGIPGHEWVGVVTAADDPAWIGRRVVGEINVPCGHCSLCRRQLPNHCPERTVLGIVGRDGAFAEYLSLPIANLQPVPDGVPDEQAVFCEPLAAACQILEQVHVHPTNRVAVLGVGRLGQLCARVLALTGAEVSAIGRSPGKLDRLSPGITGLRIADAEHRPGFDLVVDCTGSAAGLELATRLVRPRGTIVLKTTVAAGHRLDLAPWVIHELTVVGSRCGPFAAALRLLAAGLVDPTPLIDARYDLCAGAEALARATEPGVLKVLLNP